MRQVGSTEAKCGKCMREDMKVSSTSLVATIYV